MADVFRAEKRSEIMSRIKSKGTRVEETLYSLVRHLLGPGRRVERNVVSLPGRPDIVVRSLRLAIFADGCFYHCCPRHGHKPKSNLGYWLPKLARNSLRDRTSRQRLRRLGYSVWAIWEHALEGGRLQHTRVIIQRRLRRIEALKRNEKLISDKIARSERITTEEVPGNIIRLPRLARVKK
jgi:DNA mismatch endonuclease, patch repair protein